nr:ribonuclease H-like domain-containing protein [Tanacetum cinerariifolium]
MDQQYPTVARIPILDTRKFEQWQFWIQKYLQHEHYALWEVIEFGDSYEVPESTTTIDTTSGETGTKSRRTVTLTAEDMQKKKNDVKERTTLLLSLPDEHQLRFSKYKTTRELWAAILKTFGGNEATKKTKKNLLKQQYGNFKAKGSETLEQTFNRLQVIVGQLQFMDVELEQDDLNQKFLTSLAPEWLMHTIIDEDDKEEMDIKWNMALLSMRADKFWKKTGKKISIQRSDVARISTSGKLVEYKEREVKHCEKIKTLEFRNGSNNECIEILKKKIKTLKQEKEGVDGKLAGLLTASKNLDNLIESHRSDKNKDGLGYSVVPPPPAQLYLSLKKDLSWTGDDQSRNPFGSETVATPITPKPFIKFVKPKDSQSKSKIDETETPKKPPVKYAEQYRKPNKKPNVRGNQRNWNNLKSQQLGPDFIMKKKACFNCGGYKITGKGTIKTGKLEFENVYFVKDLKYNLFSVSQICDNKNNVLFTDSECIVLLRDFKLLDDANI